MTQETPTADRQGQHLIPQHLSTAPERLSWADAKRLLSRFPCCFIKPGKKAPQGDAWQDTPRRFDEWRGQGLGVLCGYAVQTGAAVYGLDVDVPEQPELARAYAGRLREFLADRGGVKLCRIGKAPKFLVPFRMRTTQAKRLSRTFHPLDTQTGEIDTTRERACRLEVLGKGQQFVAYAEHPETRRPYRWGMLDTKDQPGQLHETTPEELVELSTDDVSKLLAEFERMAEAHGLVPKATNAKEAGKPGHGKSASPYAGPSVVEAYNRHHPLEIELERFGYVRRGERWLSPNSDTGEQGVILTDDGRKWLSAHASDAEIGRSIENGTMGDAFDLFVYYEHAGDRGAALREVREEYGDDVSVDPGAFSVEWSAPKPLTDTRPPVEPFDEALLPDAFRPWVMDAADRMQAPPDFTAVAIMVAASSVIGRKCVIQPKRWDDWRVVPNLWGAVIGRPGVMKSPALKAGLLFLHQLAAQAREQHHEEMRNHEVTLELAEINKKTAKSEAEKAAKRGDHQKARDLLADAKRAEEEAPPPMRRPIVNDATVEALGEILIDNPTGTLAYRDELHGLLKSLDREGQEGARAFYLQAYDGDDGYTFDRIIRGKNLHIPAVCLAMLGGIQPSRIRSFIRDAATGSAGDDGLIQRFGMMVYPDMPRDWRNVDRWPDNAAKAKAAEVFERLEAMEPDPSSDSASKCLTFDDEARERFVEWHTDHMRLLRSGTLHPAMESHLSKYLKLVPAIALICALVDGRDEIVGLGDLRRAIAWSEYLRSHAERVYAEGANQAIENARTIERHMARRALPDPFTAREVQRKGWTGLATREAVEEALEVLVDHGHIRVLPSQKDAIGRPTIRYEINPAVLTKGRAA